VRLAKQEGTLSLYTSMTQDVADVVTKRFTDQFGIPISVFRAIPRRCCSGWCRRARRTGSARTRGDQLPRDGGHDQTGQLTGYTGAALGRVKDTGKFPHWTATRFNLFLPAWNTNLIKPGEEPRSWEDLADPRYRGKITVEVSDSDWYENLNHVVAQPR